MSKQGTLMPYDEIYAEIKETLLSSRQQTYVAVNFAMVKAYWQIGRIIVEHENAGDFQLGNRVPEFAALATRLSAEFGKGFSVRTLQQMRKFYLCFPDANALRSRLTWTHYRLLLQVENEEARNWYMNEAVESGWSSRQLDRQISSLYYERLLASRDKTPVKKEADELLAKIEPEDFIKDPYVLEFLNNYKKSTG